MASFLPFVFTTASPSVKDEEFLSFHSIDRKLYIRLIVNLGRDPSESMQVMAFWLWLEQDVVDNLTLVSQMLSFPPSLVNELADESVMCLKCVETDKFPCGDKDPQELVLLPSFVERNISFQYFHENRVGVLRGVAKLIGEVCYRAFRDLFEKNTRGTGTGLFVPVVLKGSSSIFTPNQNTRHGGVGNPPKLPSVEKVGETSSSFGQVGKISQSHGGVRNPNTPLVEKVGETSSSVGQVGTIFSGSHGGVRNPNSPLVEKVSQISLSFSEAGGISRIHGGARNPNQPSVEKLGESFSFSEAGNSSNVKGSVVQTPPVNAAPYRYWLPSYNRVPPVRSALLIEEQIMENELRHRLNTSLSALMEENGEISADERTIFLTFSKGYPISETEVREFFTRKFGDFIEAIHMQEVGPNEQVLYARIVTRSASALDVVVEGGRVKYTINGKHVWARKYVRKQKSPPRDAAFSM